MYNELTLLTPLTRVFECFKRVFRNKYWVGAIVLGAILLFALWLFPTVFADYSNIEGVKTKYDNFISGAQESSVKYMKDAYESFSFIYKPENQGGLAFADIMRGTVTTLAGGAISIYFAVNIIKEAQKGDLTIDYWQKVILNLVISLVVTLLATRIMGAIYEGGRFIIDYFITGAGEGAGLEINDSAKDNMAQLLSKIPGLDSLHDIVSGGKDTVNYENIQSTNKMVVALEYVVWFPMVICVFLMYSAIFEIKVRELFAPFAVTSIMVEGSRGGGARYLKKYAACFLKIAIYFAIAYLGMEVTKFFFDKVATEKVGDSISINLIFMLMANVVAGMAMMQTGGLADEIIGV